MRSVKKKRTPAKANRRKTPRGRKKSGLRLSPTTVRWGGMMAAAGLLLGGATWSVTSGWLGQQVESVVTAGYQLTADAGLAVSDVLVEGRQRTDPERLLAQIGVARGTPILAVDLQDTRARLETLPWIERADIERRLPGDLFVRLVERQPLALWQLKGEVFVIDGDGAVIENVKAADFEFLPLVVGPGAPDHTKSLLAMLSGEPDLQPQVMAAVRVSDRRWNLRMAGNIDIRLPEDGVATAWAQFARMEREHGLLSRDISVIDLRLPDRLVVRTNQGSSSIKALPTGGSNT